MDFEVIDHEAVGSTIVKVIGVGGGGSNAVNRMIQCGVEGVEFIAANTDLQALNQNQAQVKLALGKKLTGGQGAGGKPEIGEKAAEEEKETIQNLVSGTHMVFITAGMGGGTGTGAAPVIARVAKEEGALTVGVVTKPFAYEKKRKMELAMEGIEKLRAEVDALIVIPNEKIMSQVDRNTSFEEAYLICDDVLRMAVQGISEVVTTTGEVNIDFADVKSVMKGRGDALMGMAVGRGDNRGLEAAAEAIDNPLLENVSIEGATGLLVYVVASRSFSFMEYNEVQEYITSRVSPDAEVKSGMVLDDLMNDEVKITVIATGFNHEEVEKESTASSGQLSHMSKHVESDEKVMPYDKFAGLISGQSAPPAQKAMPAYSISGNSQIDSDLMIPAILRKKGSHVEK